MRTVLGYFYAMTSPAIRHALDSMPCAAWTADARGDIDWLSREAVRCFGVQDAPLPLSWSRLVHPGDWPRTEGGWQRAVASGAPFEARVRLLSAQGHGYRWHVCRAQRLTGADGEVFWAGIYVDVDEPLRGMEVQHASLERL